jgi:hypothetical protein
MIKSFIFSLLIAIVSVAVIIGGEKVISKKDDTATPDFVLQKYEGVDLASEASSEDSSEYTLLLGKDGSVVNTVDTNVSLTVTDADNYLYNY